MAAILKATTSLWLPKQYKPQGIPRIDWSHPLANGLKEYWWDNGSGRYIDLVGGGTTISSTNPKNTTPAVRPTPYGAAAAFTAVTDQQNAPALNTIQAWTFPYTVACGFYQFQAPTYNAGDIPGWFGISNNAAGDDIVFIYGETATTFKISYANTSGALLGVFPATNTFNVVVGVADQSAHQVSYWNLNAPVITTGTSNFTGTNMGTTFGDTTYNSNLVQGANGSAIFFGAIWLRALSAEEAKQLYLDPYCFLVPPSSPLLDGILSPPAPATPSPQVWFDPELVASPWFDPEINLVGWYDREFIDPPTGPATQALTPALVTNSQTFFAPTIAAGTVNLTPSLVTNTSTFPVPTVLSIYSLTPGLFTNSQTFFAPTVLATYNLTPSLFTNPQTFFTATVGAGAVDLSPALVTNSQTFFTPIVSLGGITLSPGLFTNSQTFFAPAVAAGGVDLAPALFTNAQTFFTPSVSTSYSLTPALVTNAQTFFAPALATVSPLTPALFTNPNSFFAPTVLSTYGLAPALVTNGQTFPPATVVSRYGLAPALFTNPQSFFVETVSAGAVNLSPALFTDPDVFFGGVVSQPGVPSASGLFVGIPFIATMGMMTARGGGAVAPVVNWVDDWTLGGITPSIVLDFANTRYYDGGSNSATLASMVQNTGTIDSTGLIFTGANNVNCIGALLTALQQTAVTVVADIAGLPNGQVAGILSFGSGNPDSPIIADDNAGGYFNAWNGASLATNYVDSTQINDAVGPVRVASRWNAGNRGIVWNNTSPVAVAASAYAAVTSAKLGNYGANALPYTGKLRHLAIYPSFVNDTLLKGLSWRGAWPLPVGGRGVKLANNGDFCTPGMKFNYEYTQPWTMTCSFFINSTSVGGVANVFFSNVGTSNVPPWIGYEAYVTPAKKLRVRIMSSWDGAAGNGIIEVDGSSNVCDAHNVATITYDGSGTAAGVKMYLNGVLETNTVNRDTLNGSIANANNFCVGYQESGAGSAFFFGDLMMTFIFDNIARNQTYITANHSRVAQRGRQPVPDANTQLYYDFRELSGFTTADRSSNGFNATMAGTFVWVTSIW